MKPKTQRGAVALFACLALAATSGAATTALAAPVDPAAPEDVGVEIEIGRASIGWEHPDFAGDVGVGTDTSFYVQLLNISDEVMSGWTLDFEVPESFSLISAQTPECSIVSSRTASCQIPDLARSDSMYFHFDFHVPSSAAGDLALKATVHHNGTNSRFVEKPLNPIHSKADLSVSQEPAPEYQGAPRGVGPQPWDVVITNHSDTAVERFEVYSELVDDITNSRLLPSDWEAAESLGLECEYTSRGYIMPQWHCVGGELGPHESITIPFAIDIDGVPCPGSSIQQKVWVGPFVNDPNPEFNYNVTNVYVDNDLNLDTCPVSDGIVTREGGKNRYDTANMISYRFPFYSDVIYLASGQSYPDALAASAAGGFKNVPVLLTETTRLPSDIQATLKVFQPERVVIVGGPGVVSEQVVAQVQASLPKVPVERVGGNNRFETAAKLAQHAFPSAERVYVASGMDFPDALAAAAAAGAQGSPVLLSLPDELPADSAKMLAAYHPKSVVMVGGEGVMSPKVAAEVKAAANGVTPVRYGGANRMETARLVALGEFGQHPPIAVIANAFNYPDALVGAVVAGSDNGPVLLTSQNELSKDAKAVVQKLAPQSALIVGGTAVVSDEVLLEIRRLTGMQEPLATGSG